MARSLFHHLQQHSQRLFERLGNVANGVRTILNPHELVDSADAIDVASVRGDIEFDHGFCPKSGIVLDTLGFAGRTTSSRNGQLP